ncbi:MAG: helix-turn-helix transcriptional regulator [Gemmatimonadota bacterium]|nr:MAG: helix-turn-helix transcriptional regulator [Gemmatimonadota bacterium]
MPRRARPTKWFGFESKEELEKYRDEVLKRLLVVVGALTEQPFTLQSVAKDVGVSKPTVTRWIQGERRPTPKHLDKLVAVIGERIRSLDKNLWRATEQLVVLRLVQSELTKSPGGMRKRRGK